METEWTKTSYFAFLEQWKENIDEKYRVFNEKIVKPSEGTPTLGIRSPIIKKTAKEICKGNPKGFLAVCEPKTHEERLLMGFVLCEKPQEDFDAFLKELDSYLQWIDNWAICDSLCSALKKPLKGHKAEYWEHITGYLTSDNPWIIRVGLVSMLAHYIDETYLKETLARCDKIKYDHYYVKIAQAWLVSTAMAKFPEQTKAYLLHCSLDQWTYNKSIQKSCESFRVSDEDKTYLRTLKR